MQNNECFLSLKLKVLSEEHRNGYVQLPISEHQKDSEGQRQPRSPRRQQRSHKRVWRSHLWRAFQVLLQPKVSPDSSPMSTTKLTNERFKPSRSCVTGSASNNHIASLAMRWGVPHQVTQEMIALKICDKSDFCTAALHAVRHGHAGLASKYMDTSWDPEYNHYHAECLLPFEKAKEKWEGKFSYIAGAVGLWVVAARPTITIYPHTYFAAIFGKSTSLCTVVFYLSFLQDWCWEKQALKRSRISDWHPYTVLLLTVIPGPWSICTELARMFIYPTTLAENWFTMPQDAPKAPNPWSFFAKREQIWAKQTKMGPTRFT